jgi:hypothetical protein
VFWIDLSGSKNDKGNLTAIAPSCWKITSAKYNVSRPHVAIDVINMFKAGAKPKMTMAWIKGGMPLEHTINILGSTQTIDDLRKCACQIMPTYHVGATEMNF